MDSHTICSSALWACLHKAALRGRDFGRNAYKCTSACTSLGGPEVCVNGGAGILLRTIRGVGLTTSNNPMNENSFGAQWRWQWCILWGATCTWDNGRGPVTRKPWGVRQGAGRRDRGVSGLSKGFFTSQARWFCSGRRLPRPMPASNTPAFARGGEQRRAPRPLAGGTLAAAVVESRFALEGLDAKAGTLLAEAQAPTDHRARPHRQPQHEADRACGRAG